MLEGPCSSLASGPSLACGRRGLPAATARRGAASRGRWRWALLLVTPFIASCAGDDPARITAPTAPVDVGAAYRAMAFTLDFNVRTGTVRVSQPIMPLPGAVADWATNGGRLGARGGSFSLLGSDLVSLRISNLSAGPVSAVAPGKVLIRSDLTVVNPLAVPLVTPVFPAPPVGVTGLQVFPFEISARTDTGQLTLSPPVSGPVQPGADWDGAPHNFFNAIACGVPQSTCFPYKAFPEIAPLGSSTPQQVGFLVDVSVSEFRVRLLLAADLGTR